jgi:hypothetical protein
MSRDSIGIADVRKFIWRGYLFHGVYHEFALSPDWVQVGLQFPAVLCRFVFLVEHHLSEYVRQLSEFLRRRGRRHLRE